MAKGNEAMEKIQDNKLEDVNGGSSASLIDPAKSFVMCDISTTTAHCNTCGTVTIFTRIQGSRGKCNTCGNVQQI
ncbi:MAG: hypothetical protein K6B72_00685 [Lachnospiraceae bacterium]|nr:hypothetical protein [Lachnospiraceae bacterium]